MFIQFDCDLHVRDTEGLSPLDLVTEDRPPHITFTLQEPNKVYTWGENNNNTLGHASTRKTTSPLAVVFFKKSNIYVKQVRS